MRNEACACVNHLPPGKTEVRTPPCKSQKTSSIEPKTDIITCKHAEQEQDVQEHHTPYDVTSRDNTFKHTNNNLGKPWFEVTFSQRELSRLN